MYTSIPFLVVEIAGELNVSVLRKCRRISQYTCMRSFDVRSYFKFAASKSELDSRCSGAQESVPLAGKTLTLEAPRQSVQNVSW